MNYQNLAGALLFVAGVVAFMGIITAEATYPGYSTHTNFISDLGGTQPPASVITQPAATIFAATLVVNGVLVIIAAYYVYRGLEGRRSVTAFSILLALSGITAIGAALFNQSTQASFVVHATFGFIGFTVGGVGAIISYYFVRSPFRYFSVILGVISLASFWLPIALDIAVGRANPLNAALGLGGLERWAAYPRSLWLIGFAGYLMGYAHVEEAPRDQRAAP
ncbi:MAG: DUF998 domain-containing protein [Halobacteriota archaeon]